MALNRFSKPALIRLYFGIWAIDLLINVINNGRPAWVPVIAVDAQIPFIPAFIYFYTMYFPLVVAPLAVLYSSRQHLENYVRASLFVMVVSFVTFLILPTKLTRVTIRRGTAAGGLTLLYHKIVAPYNLVPSLHVSMLVVAQLALWQFNRRLAVLFSPFILLCIASVVFTKQHYVLDLLTGLPLGVIGFFYGYKKRNHQSG